MSFVPVILDTNGETSALAKSINDQNIVCNRKFQLKLATAAGDVFQTVDSECTDSDKFHRLPLSVSA